MLELRFNQFTAKGYGFGHRPTEINRFLRVFSEVYRFTGARGRQTSSVSLQSKYVVSVMIGLANLPISLGTHSSCTGRDDSNVSGHSNSVRRDFWGSCLLLSFRYSGLGVKAEITHTSSIMVGVLSDNMIE